MNFTKAIESYKSYLVVEKTLTDNSVGAYISDLNKFSQFCKDKGITTPENVTEETIKDYLSAIEHSGINTRTQARTLSSLRSFFKYLTADHQIDKNPVITVGMPKISPSKPTILTVEEIDNIKNAGEKYKPENSRNRAIIEMLYSCGLRVSEVVSLKASNLNIAKAIVKIEGKGNKSRTLKLNDRTITEIKQYLNFYRNYIPIEPAYKDIFFLNNRGKSLSRVIIFNIVKALSEKAGIRKKVSPHTLRHSIASHMIDNGIDLQEVRDMLGHESILSTEIYVKN